MRSANVTSACMMVRHLVLAAMIGTGCSGAKVTTESSNDLPRYNIKSIALVPFTTLSAPQVRDQRDPHISMPESVRRFDEISSAIPPSVGLPPKQTVTVPAYAAEKLTQLFWRRLQSREDVQVLPLGQSAKAYSTEGGLAGMRPENTAATVAKKLKADAALIGQVSVFQERVGGRFGADPAASVGFKVTAVAADGRVLWVGNFYERQRPLNEDVIGFVQRFGMFVTAAELAEYGVDEVLKEFPFGTGGEK